MSEVPSRRNTQGSRDRDPDSLGPEPGVSELVHIDEREPVQPKTDTPAPRLWGASTFISLGIALALLIAMAFMMDLDAVWAELKNCDKTLAILAAVAHYATYPVRGMRWRRTLKQLRPKASWQRFGLIVFFYNFVDNIVPAKLGDLYGAHLVRINLGISRSAALGSLVFVRMVDAWFILALAIISSWAVFSQELPDSVFWVLVFGGILAAVLTAALLTFFILKHKLPAWVPESARDKILSFQTGMWPKRREFPTIFALTLLIWILEAAWIVLLAASFDISLTGWEMIFLTVIPLLASAFPLTPSGLGVVEWSLVGCLRALGIAAPVAFSLTIVNRFFDFWLHIILGVIMWMGRHKLGLRTWREAPLEDPRNTATTGDVAAPNP